MSVAAIVEGVRVNRTAPGPARFEIYSDTIEDRLGFKTDPVARDLEGRFAVVSTGAEAGAAVELLTVAADGETLVHYRQNEAALPADLLGAEAPSGDPSRPSEAGWVRREHRPFAGQNLPSRQICELRACHHEGDTLAFLHFEEASGSRTVKPLIFDRPTETWNSWEPEFDEGGEVSGEILNAITRNGQMGIYRAADGRVFVYGAGRNYVAGSPTLFIITRSAQTGRWVAMSEGFSGSEKASFRLIAPRDPAFDFTILKIDGGTVGAQQASAGYLEAYEDHYITLEGDEEHFVPLSLGALGEEAAALSAENFIPLPTGQGDAGFLFHAADGHLFHINGYARDRARITKLTDLPVLEDRGPAVAFSFEQGVALVSASLDQRLNAGEPPQVVVFAVDRTPARQLWVCRQEATNASGDPVFRHWTCLGDNIHMFAAPRELVNGPELFAVNEEHRAGAGVRVSFMAQNPDPDDGLWFTQAVDAATGDADRVEDCVTHTSEIRVVGADGSPARHAAVCLTSATPCVAIVNGIGRRLFADPAKAARAYTDAAGELTVKIRATGFMVPNLSIRLETMAEDDCVSFDPGAAVSRRLAGKDPRLKINPRSLKQGGMIPAEMGDADARTIALMIRHAGKAAGMAARGGGRLHQSGRETVREFSFVLSDDNRSLRPVASGNAVGYRRYRVRRDRLAVAADGPLQFSLKGLFGDIINWFKHVGESIKKTAEKIARVVVKVFEDAVHFVLETGGRVLEWVADTARGIGAMLEGVFTKISAFVGKIADAIKTALDFIKALFAWRDIARTSDLIRYTVYGGLREAEHLVGDTFRQLAENGIEQARSLFSQHLDTIKAQLATVDLAALQTGAVPGVDSAVMARGSKAVGMNGVQGRYVGNQIKRHGGQFVEADGPDGRLRLKGVDSERFAEDEDVRNLNAAVHEHVQDRSAGERKQVGEAIDKIARAGTSLAALDLGFLIDQMKTIVDIVAEGVTRIVALMLKVLATALAFIRQALMCVIKLPVINDLFRHATGRDLTLGDILALAVAAPVTILWKVANKGKAPCSASTVRELHRAGLFADETLSDLEGRALQGQSLSAAGKEKPGKILEWIMLNIQYRIDPDSLTPKQKRLLIKSSEAYPNIYPTVSAVLTVGRLAKALLMILVLPWARCLRDTAGALSGQGFFMKYICWFCTLVSALTGLLSVIKWHMGWMIKTFHPQSDTARKIKDRDIRAGDGPMPYITGLFGLVLAVITSGLALVIPEVPGAVVLDGLFCVIYGTIGGLLVLSEMITAFVINGAAWTTILDQVASWIATIPDTFSFFVPAIYATLGASSGWSAVLLVFPLTADQYAPLVAGILSLTAILSVQFADDWSDFSS